MDFGLAKRISKMKETSPEKLEKSEKGRLKQPRNISLPNLKKKGSNRENRRLKLLARKTSMKGLYSKYKG